MQTQLPSTLPTLQTLPVKPSTPAPVMPPGAPRRREAGAGLPTRSHLKAGAGGRVDCGSSTGCPPGGA